MKRIFYLTLTLSILLLCACSTKTETVDASSNTKTERAQSVASEPSDSTPTQPDKTNNTEIKTHQTVVPAVSGTVDDVAKQIARMAKNSSGHWSYVGGEKYQYIAVGITYEDGNWHCCIAMSRENTDNK